MWRPGLQQIRALAQLCFASQHDHQTMFASLPSLLSLRWLQFIWAKFEEYTEDNTVMLDDLR
jgi:hypothetical protein